MPRPAPPPYGEGQKGHRYAGGAGVRGTGFLEKIGKNFNRGALAAKARKMATRQKKSEEIDQANARQIGGDHYKDKTMQPWDFIAANHIGFFEGNVIKYVSRWKDKNGVEDLRKARHYRDKLLEVASEEEAKR